MKQRKSSSFNRFQHKCAEYASFNRKTISPGMSNVLLAIAHFLNARTLRCFPSYERLAEYAGINRSTVIRNVNRLVAAGIIIKTQEPLSGGGFKNVFGIAFICSDFSVPSGWQNATLSRDNNKTHKTESNNISHDVTNNTTNHNGSQSVSTKRELRSGFRWMEGLDRTKDPFEEHFDKTGSIFCQSYFPADELGPEQIGMCGVEIPEDARETIIANPVKYALRAVGREDDQILVRTLKSRQKRLPARFFGAEIVNFISMVFADRMPDRKRYFERFPEKRMRDKGRVLISRLDKAYAVYVGTHGMTQKMDVPYLWAVAEGRETFQKVAA